MQTIVSSVKTKGALFMKVKNWLILAASLAVGLTALPVRAATLAQSFDTGPMSQNNNFLNV